MHALAEHLLSHIRRQELLHAGERVGAAVSGGIDSVALLRLLLEVRSELGIVLSVVHFNHKLRGAESDADEQFVAALSREFELDFICDSDDVAGHARENGISLETAARELRYGFFRHLIRGHEESRVLPTPRRSGAPDDVVPRKLDNIVTGHTLDDQAETVLMRLIRGSGLRGMGGIHPRILVEDEDQGLCGEIVRPLLATRRRELEPYLKEIGQSWREDASNVSTKFTRNRVRKLLVPLLEKEFNPSVSENLAELADIARGEEDYWDNEVAGWMGTGVHWAEPAWARKKNLVQISGGLSSAVPHADGSDLESKIDSSPWLVMNASVDRLWLLGEPLAVQRRIIKAIGEEAGIPLEFKHVEEILNFASAEGGSGTEISLPLGWKAKREFDEILFTTPDLRDAAPAPDYEYELNIPGQVDISETGLTIEARRIPPGSIASYNPEHLLDGDLLPATLKVRNWRAGDRFWPSHTKAPKKIKELLQERHIPLPERKLWPVVLAGEEIVWMRGFLPPARLAAKSARDAIAILERTIGPER